MKKSITRSLAEFVKTISYENLPAVVAYRAKNLILDALGTAIGGREMPCSRIALELVKGDRGNATILAYGMRVSPVNAAFVNAVLTSAVVLDDFLFSFHPGQVNVPTAIAVAEQEGSSGVELISAVVSGYEVMGRVYLGAPSIVPKFRGTPVFGPFGSAAAAGKLLKLNEDQLTNALGYSAHFASGFNEGSLAGTMEGYFHGGVAARNGIMAASLAKAGATASEESLEGKQGFYQAFGTTQKVDNALHDLGKRFLIMEASYKAYPVVALQQIPIDLILRLVKKHQILAQDIKGIIEKVPYWEAIYPGGDSAGPFEKPLQALMSAPFCAAAAFLGKLVRSYSFYADNYNDPEVFALAQKVRLIGEKDRKMPEITVRLNDGKTYSIEEEEKEGTLIPTDDKIRTKFNELTSSFLGEKRVNEIVDIIMSLEKVSNIRELTQRLSPL